MVDWRRRVEFTLLFGFARFWERDPHFLSLVASKFTHLIWASKILFAIQLFHLLFFYFF